MIKSILVVAMPNGPDQIYLVTSIPDPMGLDRTLRPQFAVPAGQGVEYVLKLFPDLPIALADSSEGYGRGVTRIRKKKV